MSIQSVKESWIQIKGYKKLSITEFYVNHM